MTKSKPLSYIGPETLNGDLFFFLFYQGALIKNDIIDSLLLAFDQILLEMICIRP